MKLKKYDFIKINYIGKIKESSKIFDLNIEKIAKENNLYNPKIEYVPITICLGKNQIIRGLDQALIGKGLGSYIIELSAEQAFGKKDKNLIKLVPTNIFKKQNITPFPGLHVNIDNLIGTIRTISGGRTLVDFNHPLAGKNIIYEIEIIEKITNLKEKTKALLPFLKEDNIQLKDDKLELIGIEKNTNLEKEIKEILPEIKDITFTKQTPTKE